MRALLLRSARAVRDTIESKGAGYGLIYPWWIPVTASLALVGSTLVGTAQREALVPLELDAALALTLVAMPFVAHFALRPWLPWWIETASVLSGVALLLSDRLPTGTIDVLPAALAVLVAEVTVSEGKKIGFFSAVLASATLVLFGDFDANLLTLYIAEICFGLVFGYMLRWQMRALAAEHLARDEERERATLDERQRLAREIHDLVAHSLSVTMLHVTGARRALSEGAGPDDVAEAIDALTDAERIGRQAMADIRRTVSVLATTDAELHPLPGAADLDALVADVCAAGMEVDWAAEGDLTRLSPAAGLGLYRVVQESLANAAKHAPGAPVVVRLVVGARTVRLSVVNQVLAGASVGTDGSGVAGMTSRVGQLGGGLDVGPDGDRWRVDLAVPIDGTLAERHACVVRRLLP